MAKIFGMCFNWKVLLALGAAGLGIWVLAPNLVLTALPLLLVAACPLSMLLMMRGMGNMHRGQVDTASATGLPLVYTCPMHPDVRQAGAGECPKCGMQLVPTGQVVEDKTRASASGLTRDQQLADLKAQQAALEREIAQVKAETSQQTNTR